MHIEFIRYRECIICIIHLTQALREKLLKAAKAGNDGSCRNDITDNRQHEHHHNDI